MHSASRWQLFLKGSHSLTSKQWKEQFLIVNVWAILKIGALAITHSKMISPPPFYSKLSSHFECSIGSRGVKTSLSASPLVISTTAWAFFACSQLWGQPWETLAGERSVGGLAPRYRYQTPGKPLPDLFEILPRTERHASYSAHNEHLLVSKVRTNWLNFSTRILTEATSSISCPAIFANALSTTFIKDTVRVHVTTCSAARIIHWRFKGTKTVKSNTTIFHWYFKFKLSNASTINLEFWKAFCFWDLINSFVAVVYEVTQNSPFLTTSPFTSVA